MKQMIFLLFILTQTSIYTFGQIAETTPEARAKNMVGKIHKACNLKGNEWTKVNDAFTAYYRGVDALKKEIGKEKSTTDAKSKDLKKELNDKLTTAISAERMRMWVAYKEKENIAE